MGLYGQRSGRRTRAIDKPTAQSAEALVAFLRRQPAVMQQNGIWLVVTNPDAYSTQEKGIVEELKQVCRKQKIPLFICRGAALPNGWQRLVTTVRQGITMRYGQPLADVRPRFSL
jgi:hypothetical protein